MNILIIDDEKDTRQRIARLLSVSDNVLQADNGLEALNVLDREHIDLILTDICMPRMDGLELIRILRNQGSSAEIIVMSGYNDFNYAQKAIRYNVMDYLLKPISPLDLKKLVEDAKRRIAERNYREKYGYQPFMNLLLDGCTPIWMQDTKWKFYPSPLDSIIMPLDTSGQSIPILLLLRRYRKR